MALRWFPHAHTRIMQEGNTPAHNAARGGCADCVAVLRKYGADFYLQNRLSQSPADIAMSLGNVRCLAEMRVPDYVGLNQSRQCGKNYSDGSDTEPSEPVSKQNGEECLPREGIQVNLL